MAAFLTLLLFVLVAAIAFYIKREPEAEQKHVDLGDSSETYAKKPDARALLKKATALKKEGSINEACEALRLAYSSETPEQPIMLKERFRLAMYLQTAGDSDEGWRELNKLSSAHSKAIDQFEIHNQMRIFLQKESRHKEAVFHGVWSYVCRVIHDDQLLQDMNEIADSFEQDDQWLTDEDRERYKTSVTEIKNRTIINRSLPRIELALASLLKKAKLQNRLNPLASDLLSYLNNSENQYRAIDVKKLVDGVIQK